LEPLGWSIWPTGSPNRVGLAFKVPWPSMNGAGAIRGRKPLTNRTTGEEMEQKKDVEIFMAVMGPRHGEGMVVVKPEAAGNIPFESPEDPDYTKITLRFQTTQGFRKVTYYRHKDAPPPANEDILKNELIDALIIFNSD